MLIDIDQQPAIAQRFKVRVIPTIKVLHQDSERYSEHYLSAQQFLEDMDDLIAK